MIRLLLLGVSLSLPLLPACIPVAGDRILGRDLALANPAFSALPPSMTVAYTPAPGARRVFAVAELERIARANRVELKSPPEEVCFEIPMRPVIADEMREAMLRALPAGSELKILEVPSSNIPVGRFEFALTGLEPAPPAAQGSRLWRGSVRYGETLRTPVWARVTVIRKALAVVASKDLPLNTAIESGSLRLDIVTVPLDAEQVAERIEDVLGKAPKKAVRAGEPIPLAILSLPPLVHRGDAIRVEVRSGAAHLVFDAIAQNAACKGETVQLRNPVSGLTFHARVEESGRAVVIVPSRENL